jgi:hypothetical protein
VIVDEADLLAGAYESNFELEIEKEKIPKQDPNSTLIKFLQKIKSLNVFPLADASSELWKKLLKLGNKSYEPTLDDNQESTLSLSQKISMLVDSLNKVENSIQKTVGLSINDTFIEFYCCTPKPQKADTSSFTTIHMSATLPSENEIRCLYYDQREQVNFFKEDHYVDEKRDGWKS